VLGVEGRQGVLQPKLDDEVLVGFLRRRGGLDLVQRHEKDTPLAQHREARGVRDAVKPGTERRVAPELVQPLVGVQEHVLEDVVDGGPVAEDLVGEDAQTGLVQGDDDLERAPVAGDRGAQRLVVDRVRLALAREALDCVAVAPRGSCLLERHHPTPDHLGPPLGVVSHRVGCGGESKPSPPVVSIVPPRGTMAGNRVGRDLAR
jgi:hypothetical protein